MKGIIKIVIADDHPIFRDGLKTLLNSHPEFNVLADAENGETLLKKIEQHIPDVVLVDIRMPVLDGFEATKQISVNYPETKVIAISMNDERSTILDMIDAGANGYILKNADKSEIIEAIYSVYNGEDYFCKEIAKNIKQILRSARIRSEKANKISFNEKELKIMHYMCEELSSDEIAKEMYLSKKTIDGIRLKIKSELNVRNSIGIVKYAISSGIYRIETQK